VVSSGSESMFDGVSRFGVLRVSIGDRQQVSQLSVATLYWNVLV
jgi:hypothetical protein